MLLALRALHAVWRRLPIVRARRAPGEASSMHPARNHSIALKQEVCRSLEQGPAPPWARAEAGGGVAGLELEPDSRLCSVHPSGGAHTGRGCQLIQGAAQVAGLALLPGPTCRWQADRFKLKRALCGMLLVPLRDAPVEDVARLMAGLLAAHTG
jgi:hypothetical protein